MDIAIGLLALAVFFLAIAQVPSPDRLGGLHWLGLIGAVVCSLLSALFSFGLIAA